VLIDRYTYESVSSSLMPQEADLPQGSAGDGQGAATGALHEKVAAEPNNALHHFQIGQIHLELNEPVEACIISSAACRSIERVKFKVATPSAEDRDNEKIDIKGRRQRIEAYRSSASRIPSRTARRF